MAHFSCMASDSPWLRLALSRMAKTVHRILHLCSIIYSLLPESPSLIITAFALDQHTGLGLLWLKRLFVKLRHICYASIQKHKTATFLDYKNKKVSSLSTFQHLNCCSFFHTTWGHGFLFWLMLSLCTLRISIYKDQALLLILNSATYTRTQSKKYWPGPKHPSQLLQFHCILCYLPYLYWKAHVYIVPWTASTSANRPIKDK